MTSFGARLAAVAGVMTTVVLGGAAPAEAHTVHVGVDPSNWRSAVTAVTPQTGDVHVSLGDDAQRLTVAVTGASQVVVAGYDDEPYLRLARNGVWINQRATTTWAIAGPQATQPPDVSDHATPRWKQVATTGTWRWHDARTHWAGYALPPMVALHPDRRQFVAEWLIPLTVNGHTGVITGRLDWIPGPNPAPGAALVVVPAGLLLAIGLVRRWRAAAVVALVALIGLDVVHSVGMVTGRVGSTWTRLAALPGHGAFAIVLWLGMLACAVGIARRRHLTFSVYAAAMLSAIVFLTDGVPSIALVWRSQAITGLPVALDRYLVAALTGGSLGLLTATILLIRRLDRRAPMSTQPPRLAAA
ncbi:MAG: hypothetical protein JO079_04015 [Frankiaceae bacterium]|nr:hypothetical protein [Frankiaceae bacterium]